MTERFPPIEPYQTGMLEVGDGHRLYWETCGNPDGKPAVVLHGGPGSGCSTGMRRWFDPARYRIVLLDQRNSGRSTPHASDPDVDLSTNTTAHLIADVEALRELLGVDAWLVWGGSWGSALALAYAQAHPDRVSELVIFSVVEATRREVDWITRDMGRIFPEQWERFRDAVPEALRDGNLAAAYGRLLHDPDPAIREKAARDWCAWEDTHVAVLGPDPDPRFDDPRFRMAFARIVTHYWGNDSFLDDGALMRDAYRLAGIPGVMVHGRADVSGPADFAWRLAKVWPDAELIIVDRAGHGTGVAGVDTALLDATNRFAVAPPRR